MLKGYKNKIALIAFAIISTIILEVIDPDLPGYIVTMLYLIPYLAVGHKVVYSAARNIINGQVFDEQFLMTFATLGAFVIGENAEAVMVMTFFLIGDLFEKLAVGKSRKSISELMDIVPDTVNLLIGKNVEVVSPDEIRKGQIILVRPGERIALDGTVIDGETYVDTSALTGEVIPVKKTVGDKVISGCVNLQGLIKVCVENEFYESTASKILELVESSTLKKARSEAFITKFARYYTPAVVISALLIFLLAWIFTGEVFESIRRGLVFLVVSCPCALVISVPLSFFGGIGGASKKGILIKGSEFIEALSKTDISVFDKTGTLTKGCFSIVSLETHHFTKEEFLEYSAALECASTHPIAKCICEEYGKEIDLSLVNDQKEYSGGGIGAVYKGRSVLVGNRRLMENNDVTVPSVDQTGSVIFLAVDGEFKGYAVLDDEIKDSTKAAISSLRSLGIKTVMLTGDVEKAAKRVGGQINIDELYFGLLPQDKVLACEALLEKKKKGRTLVYVGDGINDAPVISRADVGIAMGAMGSDAAIEAADVVIMDDDPIKVSTLIKISKRTMNIVRQNIIFALGVKLIVLLMGAFGLANMWIAVFADVGVSVIAIMNAMRALRNK